MSQLATMEVAVSPIDKFREFLQTKKKRLTPEREAIVSAVYATHDHFDAEQWVNSFASRHGGSASRSTIYRTLNLLEEAGFYVAWRVPTTARCMSTTMAIRSTIT